MALRLACDLDGTVADMDAALQREAVALFGPEVALRLARPPLDSTEDVDREIAAGVGSEGDAAIPQSADTPPAPRALSHGELKRLWAHVGQIADFWQSLQEIEPGAVRRLADAAREHRWEVLFLTQRPPSAGSTAQIQTQRWLQAHGFELPSVFVMSGSRGKVAEALALDAVIDDRPENCLDVATDSQAVPLLVWRSRPDLLPPGIARTRIEVVYSLSSAIGWLEALMTQRARPRKLLDRVRDAIGL